MLFYALTHLSVVLQPFVYFSCSSYVAALRNFSGAMEFSSPVVWTSEFGFFVVRLDERLSQQVLASERLDFCKGSMDMRGLIWSRRIGFYCDLTSHLSFHVAPHFLQWL